MAVALVLAVLGAKARFHRDEISGWWTHLSSLQLQRAERMTNDRAGRLVEVDPGHACSLCQAFSFGQLHRCILCEPPSLSVVRTGSAPIRARALAVALAASGGATTAPPNIIHRDRMRIAM
jgi:hypothetical protein